MIVLTSPSGGAAAIARPSARPNWPTRPRVCSTTPGRPGADTRRRVRGLPAQSRGAGRRQRGPQLAAAAPAMPRRRRRPAGPGTGRGDRARSGCARRRDEEPYGREPGGSGSPDDRWRDLGAFGRRHCRRDGGCASGVGRGRCRCGRGLRRLRASATAGLNEPPVVAAVSSAEPGRPGRNGATDIDLDTTPVLPGLAVRPPGDRRPDRRAGFDHRRRHTGPAGLHPLRGHTQVTVVTGCAGAKPSAGPSALVSRR